MRTTDYNDFVLIDKPSGFNSHQSHPGRWGFVEFLEHHLKHKFYLVSRLDQGTSGAMVLPKSSEAAKSFTELFEQKKVIKTYLFLTDRSSTKTAFTAKSLIEKNKNSFVSLKNGAANSETQFEFLNKVGEFFLWKARPITGKSHQIRLHAEDHGIPILGDSEHGGSPFYRLSLHCSKLEFQWKGETVTYNSENPVWLEERSEMEWAYYEAQTKRKFLIPEAMITESCYRLIHHESADFKLDVFGPQAWVYRYLNTPLSGEEKIFWESVHKDLGKPLLIKTMANRGQNPQAGDAFTMGDFKQTWQASENGVRYEFRSNTGQSPGLFLDQRENRKWAQSQAKGKKVLNLFCYTGGFSVVAALSGASEVVSVDASKNFLEWTRQNFTLNGLDPSKYEYWESDVSFFLKAAAKRKRQFDLIVCDPPSFGRSKEGVFKIDKDWEKLLGECLQVLAPRGQILFSTNYEKWTYAELERKLKTSKALKGLSVKIAPGPGYDFELSEEPLMKSYILVK